MGTKVYKIQNAAGKFSTGGFIPTWTGQGKVWRSLAAVKSHVTQVEGYHRHGSPYMGARVVEYMLAIARLVPVSEVGKLN